MQHQALYSSNADWENTLESAQTNLYPDGIVRQVNVAERSQSLLIKFVGLDDVQTLISARGTVQITYRDFDGLDACRRLLESILVTNQGESLRLEPMGQYSVVDKVRSLVQEGRIGHESEMDIGQLSDMIGIDEHNMIKNIQGILQQDYPYGINLKVATVKAGCQRAEPTVEKWLSDAENALLAEGFCIPSNFEWRQNQSFELLRNVQFDSNTWGAVRVRAFLDGAIRVEATPDFLTTPAYRLLDSILDKHCVPYGTEETTEKRKTPSIWWGILGFAAGVVTIYVVSRIVRSSLQKDDKYTCTCDQGSLQ
jgi:hypothetical protein